jgi:hypothetical protein
MEDLSNLSPEELDRRVNDLLKSKVGVNGRLCKTTVAQRLCAKRSKQNWRLENPDEWRAKEKVYRDNNKEKFNGWRTKYKYGITQEDYDKILASQGGVCAICHKGHEIKNGWGMVVTKLFIDHNHKTNKARGLLCQKCNIVLGASEDNIEVLLAAIEYIKAYSNG